jgi:hypothetical protein
LFRTTLSLSKGQDDRALRTCLSNPERNGSSFRLR